MRRGPGVVLLLVAALLTGCHEQWGSTTWGGAPASSDEHAAEANVRASIPAIEAYYADNGTYAGMTLEGLHQAYDAGLRGITFGELSATTYCVQSVVGTAAYRKTGPAADLESGVCPGAPVEDAEELANPEEEAADDEAAHNVRTAIPAIEAYYADNETYAGMTVAGLRATYDSGIENVQIVDASAQTYCVESAPGGSVAHKAGPAADIVAGPCQ
jgi:Tfp pilus assembly protein PilE